MDVIVFQLKTQSKTETDFSQNTQQKCQESFFSIDQQKQSQHFFIMTPQQHPWDEWEALQKAELPSHPEVCSLPVSRAGARCCRSLLTNSSVVFLSESKYILLIITKEKAQGRELKPCQWYPSLKNIFKLLNCGKFQKTLSELYLTSHHLCEVIIGAEGKPSASINSFAFTGFSIINTGLEVLS